MKFSLMGLLFSVTSLAHAQSAVQASQPTIAVEVGKPTYIHRLHYKQIYSEKKIVEAVLYYYDNGLYKIISPGENHYCVYVLEGAFTDAQYSVSYISLPSADWGGNVARHDLTFTKGYLTFKQKTIAQVDQNIPMQYGTFTQETNPVENPAPITWQNQPQR